MKLTPSSRKYPSSFLYMPYFILLLKLPSRMFVLWMILSIKLKQNISCKFSSCTKIHKNTLQNFQPSSIPHASVSIYFLSDSYWYTEESPDKLTNLKEETYTFLQCWVLHLWAAHHHRCSWLAHVFTNQACVEKLCYCCENWAESCQYSKTIWPGEIVEFRVGHPVVVVVSHNTEKQAYGNHTDACKKIETFMKFINCKKENRNIHKFIPFKSFNLFKFCGKVTQMIFLKRVLVFSVKNFWTSMYRPAFILCSHDNWGPTFDGITTWFFLSVKIYASC